MRFTCFLDIPPLVRQHIYKVKQHAMAELANKATVTRSRYRTTMQFTKQIATQTIKVVSQCYVSTKEDKIIKQVKYQKPS